MTKSQKITKFLLPSTGESEIILVILLQYTQQLGKYVDRQIFQWKKILKSNK